MTDREEHSKWHALLQPIRDLEKNWDIDIAGELADYLEELSQITFEVDGICNLDFAEAALVVHSSSCTYGKKVEHLLKLTVSALENVRQKHERKNPGKRRKSEDDDNEQLLAGRDILRSIAEGNLQQCDENSLPQPKAPEVQPALLHDVLMAEAFPVVAHLADARTSQQGLPNVANGPSDAPTFNMILCHDHVSGALVLLKEDGDVFDAHMRPLHALGDLQSAGFHQTAVTEGISGFDAFGSPVDHLAPHTAETGCGPVHGENPGTIMDVGDEWFGAAVDDGFEGAPDMTLPEPCIQDVPLKQEEYADPLTFYESDEDDVAERGWLVVDPHDSSQNKDIPFRKKQPSLPKFTSGLKLLTWQPFLVPEFHAAATARLQWLLPGLLPPAAQKKNKNLPGIILAEPVAARRPGPALDAFGLDQNEVDQNQVELPSHQLSEEELAQEAGGELKYEGIHDGALVACACDDVGEDYADRDCQSFGNQMGSVEYDASDMRRLAAPGTLAYEELVEQYTQAVVAASHNAISQRHESPKVTSWKMAMRHVMQEQLERPAFDVHQTGEQLVQRAGALAKSGSNRLCFSDIVQCQHKYEVARCFSAFLQQVNNNAVGVVRGQTPADPFFVKVGNSGEKIHSK